MPGRGRGVRNASGHNGQSDTNTATTRGRGLADIVNRYERLGQSRVEPPSGAVAAVTSTNVGISVSENNLTNNVNASSNNGSTTTSRTSVTSSTSASLPFSSSTSGSCTSDDGRLSTFIPSHDLSKLLECPVCYEITLPPVVMCTSGHNICSECRNKCTRCPVCRSGFCEARNRLAENIVDKCSLQCRYRSLGCSQILGGRMMAAHLDRECEFRPIACRDCKVKIPYEQYINHLLNDEKLPRQFATECSTGFDIEDDDFVQSAVGGPGQSWEPTWLHCYGLDFFCHLETLGNYWWIYVIGLAPVSTLDNYLCDILVWNRDKELRFHGPVHSYRKTGEEILESGQCIVTSQNAIRSILNQGGIDVVVCIFQANDYQTPKSRNTGQPIFSPLILRANNNNVNNLSSAVGVGVGGAAGVGAAGDSVNTANSNLTMAISTSSTVNSAGVGTGFSSGRNNNVNTGTGSSNTGALDELDVPEFAQLPSTLSPSNSNNSTTADFNGNSSGASNGIGSVGLQILQLLHNVYGSESPEPNSNDSEMDAGGDADIMIISENISRFGLSNGAGPGVGVGNGSASTGSESVVGAQSINQTTVPTTSRPDTIPRLLTGGGRNRGPRPQPSRQTRESARVAAQLRASRSLDGARRRRHTQRSQNHPQP